MGRARSLNTTMIIPPLAPCPVTAVLGLGHVISLTPVHTEREMSLTHTPNLQVSERLSIPPSLLSLISLPSPSLLSISSSLLPLSPLLLSEPGIFVSFSNIIYYQDGGFVVTLDADNSTTFTATLQSLQDSKYIDEQTSVLFVEFVVYTPNMNRFTVCRLVFEKTEAGSFVNWSEYNHLSLQT